MVSEIKIQKLAGVMGWPISHSLSPQLHGFWLRQYGINGSYVPLAVSPANLESALRSLPKLGFSGTNVTVPHKEQALELVDVVDAVAKRIGAVNTIFVQPDGSLLGTNTDAIGFLENLKFFAPTWQPISETCVVLGAGGAARAVVAALVDAGVGEIRLVNRTLARAETLADDIGGPVSVHGWEVASQVLDGAGLVVNTTTLGMQGQPPLDISFDGLQSNALVTDIVYTPLITPFLEKAAARGIKTVDGLGMLLHQAAPGFEGWFGQKPHVSPELRAFILQAISDRDI